jgi:hypothetical protein
VKLYEGINKIGEESEGVELGAFRGVGKTK